MLMDIPREIFVLSALLFAYVSVKTARKTYEEKTKLNYITLLLMVLSFGWSVLAALDMIEFAAIAWFATMIISLINLPELGRHIDQQLLEMDERESIRISDFFTRQQLGWLKLAYRRGIGVSVLGYFVFNTIIYGLVLLALDYFYGFKIGISVYALTIIPVSTYRLYRQIEKRLVIRKHTVTVQG